MDFIKAFLYFIVFYIVAFLIKIPLLSIESIVEVLYEEYGKSWTVFLVWLFGGMSITFFFFILSGVSFLMSSFFDKMINISNGAFYYLSSLIIIIISIHRLYITWFCIDTLSFPYIGIILKICYTIALILLNNVVIMTSKRKLNNY